MNVQTFGKVLLIAATVVVAATLTVSVVVMGTPAQQRALRLDERRVADLDRIVDTAREHAGSTGSLAPDLTTLANRPGLRLAITDPDTALPYEYKVLDTHTFQVCATFTTDTAADDAGARASRSGDWLHPVGRQCFRRSWKPQAEQVDSADVARAVSR